MAKAQPDTLTYGTAGHGSANHIATALFELMAKVSASSMRPIAAPARPSTT